METNSLVTTTVTSIQNDLIGIIWSAIKPHIFPLVLPTVAIMAMVRGLKLFINPYLKIIGERRTATIYRLSAIVFGILWLWIWPMVQNYLATLGTGNPSWKVHPYPAPVIVVGGIFYGILNVLLYDMAVYPLWKKFFKKEKK